jgi:SAM-dependent methyltransferase
VGLRPTTNLVRELMPMTETWTRYYDAAGDSPRATLRSALRRFELEGVTRGVGVDLGCGAGRDTVALLESGWTVYAVDAESEAIERLLAISPTTDRLHTQVARFAVAEWPPCDLVNSSFALPFCHPSDFATVWDRIVASLRTGGRFSGQLFGNRDGWAVNDDMTFHTRNDAEALFSAFERESFDEVEEDGQTATGKPKHWHVFHVVARKL